MMKYKGSLNSRADVESYISEAIKAENEIIDELLKVFKETTDFWIKNKIALYIRKYDNDKISEAFIEEIKKPESRNQDGVIVDCCSYFDCTKHFKLFVDIVLNDETESFLWALDVIWYMNGPFNLNELNSAIESLQLEIGANKNPEKTDYYIKLLNFLLTQKENVT